MNNAGDFLIASRARDLLQEYRKDRITCTLDRWNALSKGDIDLINGSKGLLLTGGPAVRSNIYPGIYPLTPNLDDIKVPIITFGIGWKNSSLDLSTAYDYRISSTARPLIDRLATNSCMNSVRDYESQVVLHHAGLSNVCVTGCPVLFASDDEIDRVRGMKKNRIIFSLGVSYRDDPRMENQAKEIILFLQSAFSDSELVVALHHSTDLSGSYASTSTADLQRVAQTKFISWLEVNSIHYSDVSGGVEKMLDLYSGAKIHIGYRVHAHILMNSWGMPSMLIAEDSRGVSMAKISGGPLYLSNGSRRLGLLEKAFSKLNKGYGVVRPIVNLSNVIEPGVNEYLRADSISHAPYKERNVREVSVMEQYMKNLP